jgi:hypothetical protein
MAIEASLRWRVAHVCVCTSICYGTGYSACLFRTAALRSFALALKSYSISRARRSAGACVVGCMPRCANDIALFALQHQTLDRLARRGIDPVDRLDHEGAEQAPRDGGLDSSIYRRRPASQSSRSLEELAEQGSGETPAFSGKRKSG